MLEFDDQAQGDRPQLVLHVKADVQGSAEAVRDAVEVGPNMLRACLGSDLAPARCSQHAALWVPK